MTDALAITLAEGVQGVINKRIRIGIHGKTTDLKMRYNKASLYSSL